LQKSEGILFLANYWKILELQINVKLDVEGLQIYLLPMEKNNRIHIKISNGPQMGLKRTSNEPLWGPHGKPPLCTYMIELKHPSATVPI